MKELDQNKLPVLLHKPLVLVGMMGCGKSVIGLALAQKLGLAFFDADIEIEKEFKKPITEIFNEEGESVFRAAESEIIEQLLQNKSAVIATGGGALMNEQTLSLLKENSVMIWLDVTEAVLWERLRRQSHRPLLSVSDPKARLSELLALRKPFYDQAHIHLPIDHEAHNEVLEKLIKTLSEAVNKGSV